jgi:hypothetical protein
MPWILWVLGGFLVVIAVSDLTLRVIPKWKEKAEQAEKAEMDDILYQAYHSLRKRVAMGDEPKVLLHQIDHMLRVVLSQRENMDWLEEPNPDSVSSEIRPLVVSLFERCQKAYVTEDTKQEEIEEALIQLEDILKFYLAEKVEVWKSQLYS